MSGEASVAPISEAVLETVLYASDLDAAGDFYGRVTEGNRSIAEIQ